MDKRIFDRRFETILRRLLEIWVDFTKFCKILKICDIDQVIALHACVMQIFVIVLFVHRSL